jgi:hypothetical protein
MSIDVLVREGDENVDAGQGGTLACALLPDSYNQAPTTKQEPQFCWPPGESFIELDTEMR